MNRGEHVRADERYLGYSIEWVHQLMDSKSALGLLGAGHRIVRHGVNILNHTEDSARLRGNNPKKARMVALLHILIDARVLDRDWIEENV